MTDLITDVQAPAGPCASGNGDGEHKRDTFTRVHGIVLAGVHSWGDCPLDEVICRPLVPVAFRPLVCHSLDWLREQGVRSASVCANSDTTCLHRSLGDGRGLGLELEYFEDVMPRGPAGCVRDAGLGREASQFVVVYGTIVPRVPLRDVLRAHVASGALLTVVATGGAPASLATDALLQPAGVYVFSPEALDRIPPTGYQDIKETLVPQLHSSGQRVATHLVADEAVARITDSSSYAVVSRWAVDVACQGERTPPGYVRLGEAIVHQSARIARTCRLVGPVIVEPAAVIDDEAIVVGPTIIGQGCHVQARAVVSRSTLWTACTVGSDAVVDDCVLADEVAVDARAVIRGKIRTSRARRRSACARKSKFCRELAQGCGTDRVPLMAHQLQAARARGANGPWPAPPAASRDAHQRDGASESRGEGR